MRTTLTLDPDVAQKLKKRMEVEEVSFKRIVNDTLRAGLAARSNRSRQPFRVEPLPMKFKPGIDPNKLGQLFDQLEAEEYLRKASRAK